MEEWTNAAKRLGLDTSNSHLTAYFTAQREKQTGSMNKLIAKGKLTADLLIFGTWAASENTAGETDPEWKTYSSRRLEKWLKGLSRNLKQVDVTDVAAMHNLRIQGKKSRYVLERFAQQQATQNTLHLVAELKQLQDCLGDLQDTTQTNQLFQKLAHDVEVARESACLAGWQARRGYDAMLWWNSTKKLQQLAETMAEGKKRRIKNQLPFNRASWLMITGAI
jgi:CHAD domain-containing protein